MADFPCDALKIIGRDAQPLGPDPDLSGVGETDLVADGLRLGAAHRLASPNDAV
jgi:hypothetical protein